MRMFVRRLALLGLVSLLALSAPAFATSVTLTVDATESGGSVRTYDLRGTAPDPNSEVQEWQLINRNGVVTEQNLWGSASQGAQLSGIDALLKADPFVTNTV